MNQTQSQPRHLNFWLTDEEFLNKSGFQDQALIDFKNYCHQIYLYLKNVPCNVIVYWDRKNQKFYFKVGRNFCLIPYRSEITSYDFQRLLKHWTQQFYPEYETEIIVQRQPTEKELADLVLKQDFEDISEIKVEETFVETGVIDKVHIKDDEIIVNIEVDGERSKQVRIVKIPVSDFLKQLKAIENGFERREFINQNSRPVNEIRSEKSIEIKYEGNTLIYFIKIWTPELCKVKFEKIEELVYRWGKFIIFFSNQEQADKAINWIENYKSEYKDKHGIKKYLYKNFGIKTGMEKIV